MDHRVGEFEIAIFDGDAGQLCSSARRRGRRIRRRRAGCGCHGRTASRRCPAAAKADRSFSLRSSGIGPRFGSTAPDMCFSRMSGLLQDGLHRRWQSRMVNQALGQMRMRLKIIRRFMDLCGSGRRAKALGLLCALSDRSQEGSLGQPLGGAGHGRRVDIIDRGARCHGQPGGRPRRAGAEGGRGVADGLDRALFGCARKRGQCA